MSYNIPPVYNVSLILDHFFSAVWVAAAEAHTKHVQSNISVHIVKQHTSNNIQFFLEFFSLLYYVKRMQFIGKIRFF